MEMIESKVENFAPLRYLATGSSFLFQQLEFLIQFHPVFGPLTFEAISLTVESHHLKQAAQEFRVSYKPSVLTPLSNFGSLYVPLCEPSERL